MKVFGSTGFRGTSALIIGAALMLIMASTALGFGTFKHPQFVLGAGEDSYPVSIADFNKDGRNDFAVSSESDDMAHVYFAKKGGGFKPPLDLDAGDFPFGSTTGDYNKDGRTDLIVADSSGDGVTLLLSKPGGFAAPRFYKSAGPGASDLSVYSVATGDFNRDGRPDVVAANGTKGTVGVLINKPGGFKPAKVWRVGGSGAFPVSVIVGDFNRDGKKDLASLVQYSTPNRTEVAIRLGRGNGKFKAITKSNAGPTAGYGFVMGRFNRDNKPDLVVSNCVGSKKIYLLRGKGNGRFRAPQRYRTTNKSCGYVLAAGDFNRDGLTDVANPGEDGSVAISFQKRSGGFGAPHRVHAVEEAYSVAAGYLNNDAGLDLVVPDLHTQKTAVLYNRR